jgi:Ser/Thr protein kinase RdoA (MazF antagonist)
VNPVPDRDATVRTVDRLLARALGAVPARRELAALTGVGYVNALYLVTAGADRWVAKLYQWPWDSEPPPDRPGVEQRSSLAAGELGVRVPRLLAVSGPSVGDGDDVAEAALFEFVDGAVLAEVVGSAGTAAMETVGRMLHQLHHGGARATGWPGDPTATNWAGWLRTTADASVAMLAPGLPAAALASTRARFDELVSALIPSGSAGRVGPIHHDAHPWNVLVPVAGSPYLVDWEMARWGDPVFDVATFLLLWKRELPGALTGALARGYGPVDRHRLLQMGAFVAVWMAAEAADGDYSAPYVVDLGRQLLSVEGDRSWVDALARLRPDLVAFPDSVE